MDPVAHTLFGATLAETGLKRRSRYATATLLIGANLPDIDVLSGLGGSDFELYMRRGHTHGILALLLLPLLLTGIMVLWHRWRGGAPASPQPSSPPAPPFHPRIILALAFLSVWSHPLLDWMNTYGVRLLMPFDGRWFYGDTLFIIDPWFWLLTAAGVVLASSGGWRAISGWTLLALIATAVILTTNLVPLAVKVAWIIGVVSIVALRWGRPRLVGERFGAQPLARMGLACLLLYIGIAFGAARLAESAVAGRFASASQVQANPMPGVPFSYRFVVVDGDHYRIVAQDGTVHELARQQPDEVVRRAMADPSIRGFTNWTRFPYWSVEDAGDHWVVSFFDLRYQGPDVTSPRGIGIAQSRVPKDD